MGRLAQLSIVAAALLCLLFAPPADAKRRPDPPPPPADGPLSIEAGFELRPRRCFTFLIFDRGTIRECPITLMGSGRFRVRPKGPLLVHARVAFGVRHLRNSAWAHAITEPGVVVGAFPEDELELEVDVGVGLWREWKHTEASLWIGPALRVRGWTPDTVARFEEVGITPAIQGELMVGAHLAGGLRLVLPESLRVGFELGLEVVGNAGSIWSAEASQDPELRAQVEPFTHWTEVRTLASVVVIAPTRGPVAFFGRLGAATGWSLVGQETREAYEELGLEPDEWFHLWPEGRLIVGIRLNPGAED